MNEKIKEFMRSYPHNAIALVVLAAMLCVTAQWVAVIITIFFLVQMFRYKQVGIYWIEEEVSKEETTRTETKYYWEV